MSIQACTCFRREKSQDRVEDSYYNIEYPTPHDSVQCGDDMLLLNFFAKFSRFECALKRAVFVKKGAGGSASPAWNDSNWEVLAAGPAALHLQDNRLERGGT